MNALVILYLRYNLNLITSRLQVMFTDIFAVQMDHRCGKNFSIDVFHQLRF